MGPRGKIPSQAAFTLLELAVVAAIFFLMVAALTPFVRMARARSLKMQCAQNLRQISLALHAYAADHGDAFPARIGDLYPGYVDDRAVFDCPATKNIGTEKAPEYLYVPGLRESSDPKEAMASDLDGNHGRKAGKNVIRVGGDVEWAGR
jgi:type II secretory pathway pseudopilin PulG